MLDFAAARRTMVDCQVRTSDVTDLRLISAMLSVPRERFVPKASAELAYLDTDLPVDAGGTRGLIKAVVIAQLAGSVIALEQDPALVRVATDNMQALGVRNVAVVTGSLVDGWPGAAPYDVILLDGAAEEVPKLLLRQLKDGGRLLGIVGRAPASKAMLFRSRGADASGRLIFDAAAPTLPGFAKPAAFVF